MAIKDYSILMIGTIPIPLSSEFTSTVSTGFTSRKVFSYEELEIQGRSAQKEIKNNDGEIIVPSSPAIQPKKDISVKGEDNITLILEQSNFSLGNKLFTLINSVLAVASGVDINIDFFRDDPTKKQPQLYLVDPIKKAGDFLKKQLTICSFFSLDGEGCFFNYRLIDASFDKNFNNGLTSISFTFSNYYNKTLTNEEVEKINNISRIGA